MASNATHSKTSIETIAWCLAFSIEAVFAISTNLLTIAAFFSRRTPLQKQSSPLLTSLAFADLIVGTVVIPGWVYFIRESREKEYHPVVSIGYSSIDIFAAFASVTNHGCIAVERLLATLAPLKYKSNKRAISMYLIVFPWVCAIIIPCLTQVGYYFFRSTMFAFFVWLPFLSVLLLVIAVSYSILLYKIKELSKNLPGSSERRRRRSHRFTVTAFIVTVVSLTAWLPFVIMSAINLVVEINSNPRIVNPVKLLHFSNSLCNPIIYYLRLPHYKTSVYQLLSRCKKTQAKPAVFSGTTIHAIQRNLVMSTRL